MTIEGWWQNRNSLKKNDLFDFSETLLDSEPLKDINHCRTLRFLSKFPIKKPYNKNNHNKSDNTYKSSIAVGVRNFIKAYHSSNEKFGLRGNEFKYAKDLISFIYGAKPTKGVKISKHSISKIKNRKIIWKPVTPTIENIEFCDYIKHKLPYFNSDLFLQKGV